jgi:hypothetical protein
LPEQQLGHAVARVYQITTTRVVGAHQIAGRLDLGRRDDDRVNDLANSSHASSSASLRSVLTRSDGPRG